MDKEVLVVEVVPKARPTLAVQNTGKTADMYRIAAWVHDNGGRAWIKDNYDVQGPEMLHVAARNSGAVHDPEDEAVVQGNWIVLLSYGNFKVMDSGRFDATYEFRTKLKPGDTR